MYSLLVVFDVVAKSAFSVLDLFFREQIFLKGSANKGTTIVQWFLRHTQMSLGSDVFVFVCFIVLMALP